MTPQLDRIEIIRAWVAVHYSRESKRLVAEGAEATLEDQAKFKAADDAGLFSEPAPALAATAEWLRGMFGEDVTYVSDDWWLVAATDLLGKIRDAEAS